MVDNIIINTLSNGIRAVYLKRFGNVGFCGVAVNAGSRDEAHRYGLAHFVEHTLFKGTHRRRAWHIINRMELVGGELNAFTSKEETLVYSLFPAQHTRRALELIADLVMNSCFPHKELEKEREVVIEEIQSYRDTPSEAIYDDFEDYIFDGNALGHNILGTEDSLRQLSGIDCRRFISDLYVPENMVVFGVGNEGADAFFKMAERYFSPMHHPLVRPERITPVVAQPFSHIITNDHHQTHCVVGAPTPGMHHENKYALLLLNNMLGGPGMNSLLNVAIRERRGYAYTVESAATLWSDCGLLSIYFGCDNANYRKCLKIINNTLDHLATTRLSERAISAAKNQFSGQLLVSSESLESTALSMAKGVMNFGKVSSVEEIADRIRAISADEVRNVAATIAGKYSTLTFE